MSNNGKRSQHDKTYIPGESNMIFKIKVSVQISSHASLPALRYFTIGTVHLVKGAGLTETYCSEEGIFFFCRLLPSKKRKKEEKKNKLLRAVRGPKYCHQAFHHPRFQNKSHQASQPFGLFRVVVAACIRRVSKHESRPSRAVRLLE